MARPSKYDPRIHLYWARGLAMQGLIDDEIADQMGIARSTLKKWEAEIPAFSDAIKRGKAPADFEVEQKLYQRAIGYTYEETKTVIELAADGTQKPARIEKTKKTFPPDVVAQIFWLKNRKPKEWRDKHEIEETTRIITGFEFEQVDGNTGEGKG